MISAKLMKSLEEEGFALEFPGYASNEERIIEILKENNERLLLALPLLFRHEFNYEKIRRKLKRPLIHKLNQIIIITENIFKKEKIESTHLKTIIKQHSLKQKITKEEFEYYHNSFKDFIRNEENERENILKKQIALRGKLSLNQALSTIYSPGKLRIMNKIFNHEILTNSELKYYYRSIRPLILAILDGELQKYLRIIESMKKSARR